MSIKTGGVMMTTREKKNVKYVQGIVRGFVIVVASATAYLTMQSVVAAESTTGAVQSYGAERSIDVGTIVELTGENSDQVKIATQGELQNMFGVVIDPLQLPIRIKNDSVKNETYVAVSGTYNVLVSTQGGAITTGDYVTLSAINGVAMKAGTEEATVFGRAAGSFDGKGVTRGATTLSDVDGNTSQTVTLGTVPVTVDIRSNPNEKSTKAKVPEILERVGQAIAEKEVSPIRIYLSLGITAVSLLASLIIIYTGVRNSIISIGRNPMSKRSILRALIETILSSFLILIIGLFAVYLLLRL